jgi:hypothetical protein
VFSVAWSRFPYASQLALRPAPQDAKTRRVAKAAKIKVVFVFMVFVLLLLPLTEEFLQSYNF